MKLRNKAALLLVLLSLRAGRAEPRMLPARPSSAPQRHRATASPAKATPRTQRRRPLRPRPEAGRRSAANLEKLARRPGDLSRSFQKVLPPELWIQLAIVACGSRLEETLVMLNSAVLFSHGKILFHIFTEEALKPEFDKQLREWPDSYTKKFDRRGYSPLY